MKIAILSNYYLSSLECCGIIKLKVGHPFPWVKNLAIGLSKIHNNDVHIITINKSIKHNLIINDNHVTYHFLQASNKYIKGLSLYESDARIIRKYLKNNRYDIVHGHGFNTWGYRAVNSELPNVVTIHLYVPPNQYTHGFDKTNVTIGNITQVFLDRINRKRLLKQMKYVISISPFLTQQLKLNKYKGNIIEIENPVSPVFFDKYNLTNEGYILYVGGIDRRKSLMDILIAMTHVKNIKLKIVTHTVDGDYYNKCINFIKNYNLTEKVEIIGPMKNESIVDIMKKCSFVVLPSKKEMAPMVISEAMAIGKAVLASNVDGVPYMIKDGITGLLFEPGNIKMLIEKMLQLFNDKNLRSSIGKYSREEAFKRWHPDIIALKTLRVYQMILKNVH